MLYSLVSKANATDSLAKSRQICSDKPWLRSWSWGWSL